MQAAKDKAERHDLPGRKVFRRHLRLRVTFGLFLIASLLTIACVSQLSSTTYVLLAPGPLSSPHAQLWQGTARADSCVNCHPAVANDRNSAVLNTNSALTNVPKSGAAEIHPGMSQREACTRCHANELHNLLAGTPHDLPIEELQKLGQPESQHTRLASSDIHTDWQHRSFACSDCHREHQGRFVSLSAMDNTRCQACHQKRFDSFDGQHSDFQNWPLASQESAIAFNHRSHAAKHFPKEQAQFDCKLCHTVQETGRAQLVSTTNFEMACAACHQKPLATSLADGVVLWQLPSIDLEQVDAPGESGLKDWPAIASAVNDLQLTPLMRKLLVAELESNPEPAFQRAALQVQTIANLSDLESQSLDARESITAIATASKSILQDVSQKGQKALTDRLSKTTADQAWDEFDRRLIGELMKGVPPDIFDEAYRNWFVSPTTQDSVGQEPAGAASPSPFLPEIMPPVEIGSDTRHTLFTSNMQDDDLLGETDDLLAPDSPSELDEQSSNVAKINSPRDFNSRVHLTNGGWMIDRIRNAIVYIPSGHADRWMQAYAEWLLHSDVKRDTQLSSMSVTSRCLECHISPTTRNSLPDAKASLTAAWRTKMIDPAKKKLTRFDHRPHLTLPQLRDCEACHQMTEMPSPKSALVSVDSANAGEESLFHHATSGHDFEFMSKKMCIQCHNSQTKVQDCSMCHDYHVAAKPKHSELERP